MRDINQEIELLTQDIRLPGIRKNYKSIVEEFEQEDKSYKEFLYSLLQSELVVREQSREKSRIRQANFPYKRYLSQLDLDYLPADGKARLSELETLEFISQGRNIVLAGNPGTGKTHLAIGLNKGLYGGL